MDRTISKADRLERMMYGEIDALYDRLTAPVLKKHQKTLERFETLLEKDRAAEARRLLASSGFLSDMTRALSHAGRESGDIIRRRMLEIREVFARDDAPEA